MGTGAFFAALGAFASSTAGCGDLILPAQDDAGTDNAANTPEGDTDAGADAAKDAKHDSPDTHTSTSDLTITSFTASSTRISENESVTFTVIFDDGHGVSNVESVLITDDGGATYALMQPAGSWMVSRSIGWSQINASRSIDFRPPGASRTFIAVVRNRQGKSRTMATQLALHCAPEAQFGACGGHCTDFWASSSCGGCGQVCTGTCTQGVCQQK